MKKINFSGKIFRGEKKIFLYIFLFFGGILELKKDIQKNTVRHKLTELWSSEICNFPLVNKVQKRKSAKNGSKSAFQIFFLQSSICEDPKYELLKVRDKSILNFEILLF